MAADPGQPRRALRPQLPRAARVAVASRPVLRGLGGLVSCLVLCLVCGVALGPAVGGAPVVAAPMLEGPVRSEQAAGQTQTQTPAGRRLPDPEPSTEASKQEASAVLSGAEYQEPPKSFWETVAEWLQEQLGKVFSTTGSFWGGFAYIMLALLIGAVLFILVRLRGTTRVRGGDAGFAFDLEDRRPPAEWAADAERFEARGEWKQALRCRFRALVGELIDVGALRDLPGRTTGEYRLEMRRFAPSAADAFGAGAELFERAWYGDEPTGPQENARFRELAQLSAAGARAAARGARDDEGVPA